MIIPRPKAMTTVETWEYICPQQKDTRIASFGKIQQTLTSLVSNGDISLLFDYLQAKGDDNDFLRRQFRFKTIQEVEQFFAKTCEGRSSPWSIKNLIDRAAFCEGKIQTHWLPQCLYDVGEAALSAGYYHLTNLVQFSGPNALEITQLPNPDKPTENTQPDLAARTLMCMKPKLIAETIRPEAICWHNAEKEFHLTTFARVVAQDYPDIFQLLFVHLDDALPTTRMALWACSNLLKKALPGGLVTEKLEDKLMSFRRHK